MKKFILTYLLFVITSITFGQSKKVWLYQADYYYEKQNYPTALRLYQMVLDDSLGLSTIVIPYEATLTNQKLNEPKPSKKDSVVATVPVTDYVYHQIALCYRHAHDYERALENFKISAERGKIPDDYYYVANSLMMLGKYEEAMKAYDEFIMQEGTSDELLERALTDMSGCDFATKVEADDDIFVNIADTAIFNKGMASFGVSYWHSENKVVFSSAREGNVILDPESQDPEYILDLYYAERDDESSDWNEAINFGRPLNTSQHEASGWFNNQNAIFFTRWSDDDKRYKHIFVSREISMRFFESQKLDSLVNLDSCNSINPFVTEDGRWLYFASDRPGGYGGLDIWKVRITDGGLPKGEPKNLGKPINSEFDEKTPFFHEETQTLFFSSDGHKTLGGLDVFKSKYDESAGNFRIPENMGIPINSTADDAYFVVDKKLRFGYLSSKRGECTTCDSTFQGLCSSCYKIFHTTLPELEFKIKGYVYDMVTGDAIPNATIDFKDISYKWDHFKIQADENGYYEHDLIPELELFLRASSKGYFADQAVVFTKGANESKNITQDFYLEKIPDDEITIEGIEYDFNKATLRPKSKEILDKLIEFLELNNNLKIEIRSHTDFRGSDTYNQDLSQRRAQSVVDYLIEHGIPMNRLVPKGYGESMPSEIKDGNGQIVTLTEAYIKSLTDEELIEEYHQRNRRTAFFVLGE
ncbi:OmpA family protein [Paracrocinitomix mangrovi]|uniref:OmpA family protein n=1 Tax=Paracrocinitomix mangrovi TaxID=2862509 RepID=UPI001C8F052E|nr:OmpA family protein [Paracrocinitomix mangrovi]UKN02996.1 OmpA family protein [Paracrocinitomix mangrovi]